MHIQKRLPGSRHVAQWQRAYLACIGPVFNPQQRRGRRGGGGGDEEDDDKNEESEEEKKKRPPGLTSHVFRPQKHDLTYMLYSWHDSSKIGREKKVKDRIPTVLLPTLPLK